MFLFLNDFVIMYLLSNLTNPCLSIDINSSMCQLKSM